MNAAHSLPDSDTTDVLNDVVGPVMGQLVEKGGDSPAGTTAVLGLLLASPAAPGVARTPVSFSGSFPIT
jgi:hypothetical protein